MGYRYLEDIALSDAAFEAWGATLEELFIAAADASMNIMVADLSKIQKQEELTIELTNPELDMLLFNFLNELVYFKDARKLLLRVEKAAIDKTNGDYTLKAKAYGEVLNPKKHPLGADVKAVTLHRLSVKESDSGWKTTVVLDI